MAKEQCVICGKMVGGIYKMALGDGNTICTDCWTSAKTGIGTSPKQFTLDGILDQIQNNPKAIAAREKKAQRADARLLKEEAAQVKRDRKNQDALDKLGLNLDRYSDEELREKKNDDVQQMAATLLGSKFMSFGSMLSGNADLVAQVEMDRVQIAQNNIIIRQNEEIIRLLRRLSETKLLP